MRNKIIMVFALLSALCSKGYIKEGEDNNKIEIYLLNKLITSTNNDIPVKDFMVGREDLNNLPLISDNEIIGYKAGTYEIILDSTSCQKIAQLEPSSLMGRQFAVTLNKKPIITGYFWNKNSSYGVNWYTIFVDKGPAYKIHKGIPEEKCTDLIELRDNIQLINAFKKTNRLIQ